MKELEKQYKALANIKRLNILKYLKRVEQATVGEIAFEIKLTLKATSKHLRILDSINAVDKSKHSLNVFYFLADKQSSIVKQCLSQM